MIRIAIVGAGGISRRHISALQELDGTSVSAIVDINQSSAEALADRTGARAFPSVDEALGHFDAAYVLTPPRARVELIRTLAQAGKAVFCEKPLAATLQDAAEIASIVDGAGTTFMMGFMRRWHPPYGLVKHALENGELGRPIQLFRQRLGFLPQSKGNWRVDAAQLCGLTVESASHDIDLLRWLGGEIVAATGVVHESNPELPGYDDTVAASLRFASGATGMLQVSWASRVQQNQLGVFGTDGADVITGAGLWASERLQRSRSGQELPMSIDIDPVQANDDGYLGENRAFLALLRGEEVAHPNVQDGLRTVEISHDILASSRALESARAA